MDINPRQQATSRHGLESILLKEGLPRLNENVPAFGAALSLYPDIASVQQPLQQVYRIYMEYYIVSLTHFASHPTRKTSTTLASL